MADKLQYHIEFTYDENGQIFQTGALLTPEEVDQMESVLEAYSNAGAINEPSVVIPAAPVPQDFDAVLAEIIAALQFEVADHEQTSECQNCGYVWPTAILPEVEDLLERVAPGDIMPSGECPSCGAVCHLVKEPANG